ncbi:heterokaryon incompatibility protein-domain-containing protein, partial [Paraphoma chrysanthemicola]
MASTPQHQHLDEGEVPSFRHQPPRLNVASIRLLDILPLGNDGIIRCKIRHSTLATPIAPKTSTNWNCAPSYTCLSYVWGSDDSMKMIMVNDERFPVRENVYRFLQKYVNGKDSIDVEACAKSIWIDALCIDQASIQERNHQVQQMGRIYSQAQEVIVWLGDDVGFDELFRFAATLTPFERRRDARQVARHIEFIHALSENSYWSRAWITQELALARAVHFIAHNSSVRMESLLLMGASVKQTYGEDVFLKLYRPLREHQRGSLALNVCDNLWRYRDKACSDERDLVYSLLSMSRNGAKVQVSYQCTLMDLALDVLRSCAGGPCL